MATIHNSKAKLYEHVPQSGEEAKHVIESEADVFIKELSRNQLDTNISLEQQLRYKKEFQLGQIYLPEDKSTAGVVTPQNFKELCVSEEISRNGSVCDDNQPENKHISRHLEELALAVKPNSLETKLLQFAISCNAVGQTRTDIRPADHPINQLKDIEHDRFGYLLDDSNPTRTAKTILRKRQQLLESISDPIEIKRKPVLSNGKSLWDVTEKHGHLSKSRKRLYTCSKGKLFTIRDREVVEVKTKDDSRVEENRVVNVEQTDDNDKLDRLSEEDIKKLPRFKNYDRGNLSETLYVKNLAHSVTEADLSSLFAKYQKSGQLKITYRLLKHGRMRGQAFVNCHYLDTAKEALEGLNGVLLRGKPIIIQFGSSRT